MGSKGLSIPWGTDVEVGQFLLTAEQYLKVTYMQPTEHGDVIEHICGPSIYQQKDPSALVEGPLRKTELNSSEYVVCSDPRTGNKNVVEGPIMYMPRPSELIGPILK